MPRFGCAVYLTAHRCFGGDGDFSLLLQFLGDGHSAVTVPLSLIGVFAVLYLFGFSLDNLSLMALSISVGFVVDDAVVVIENIVRHPEEGVVRWRPRSRDREKSALHNCFDYAVVDCGLHSIVPDGRLCRKTVPGICGDRKRIARPVALDFVDAHADARAPAQSRNRTTAWPTLSFIGTWPSTPSWVRMKEASR